MWINMNILIFIISWSNILKVRYYVNDIDNIYFLWLWSTFTWIGAIATVPCELVLLPVSSLADCRVFLASAAATLLTKPVNFRATSGLRSHWTGHSQEVKLRQIGSLPAKSQIYSSSQEGVSSRELDFQHAWINNELHQCGNDHGYMWQITMSATRNLWTMQTIDTFKIKRTTNLN